jgi:hypothetical protein
MNKCFYWVQHYDPYTSPKYIKLIPTGRYKILYGPQYDNNDEPVLYIEHRGRFLKSWVNENEIVEKVERIEFVNDCN